ncbi:hypothetical protein AFLA_012633 [Aspergillus flavus NRRL3357]|nr:hypothetical protein AFLA_012633 [Aspergillus flavus NRRL3357]
MGWLDVQRSEAWTGAKFCYATVQRARVILQRLYYLCCIPLLKWPFRLRPRSVALDTINFNISDEIHHPPTFHYR